MGVGSPGAGAPTGGRTRRATRVGERGRRRSGREVRATGGKVEASTRDHGPVPRRVVVLGVPMDLGADRRGVDMGPSAIRYAGLNRQLAALGMSIEDRGNLYVAMPENRPRPQEHLK